MINEKSSNITRYNKNEISKTWNSKVHRIKRSIIIMSEETSHFNFKSNHHTTGWPSTNYTMKLVKPE